MDFEGRGMIGLAAAALSACVMLGAAAQAQPVKSDAVAALLPKSIREAGVLRIAVPDIGKPLAYKDGDALKGMDVDLALAVAAVMGVQPEISLVPFAAALPGLQADKFDISYGEFYVTAERLAVADFVTNWQDYSSFLVTKASGYKPSELDQICGHTLGAMAGSAELEILGKGAEACGDDKTTISAFPSINNAVLALNSGRVDGVLINRGGAQESIILDAGLDASGEIGGGPTATAVAQTEDSEALLAALKAAYDDLIATGEYARILEANDTAYGAATEAVIYTEGSTPPKYGF